jgi:hypothetical protein
MYNYTATLEIALTTTDRAAVILSQVNAAIYRADDYFQAEIAPRVIHAGILAIHYFIQATIATYCTGIKTGRWYRAWAADYYAPLPVVETLIFEPQPLLPPAPVVLALPAAKPERTMVQRLEAMAGRQADRQVPSVGVICPPTKFKAPRKSKKVLKEI